MNLAVALLGLVATTSSPSYDQPPVEYRIDARLNATEHVLVGRSQIRWHNRTGHTLGRVYLHLYPNVYRDRYSTAAREKDFYHDHELRRIRPEDRGYLDVEVLRVDGAPVPFQVLDTVLRVDLPQPLGEGSTLELELEWFEKVRRFHGGGGYRGEHYELTGWYPKLAVHDGERWHAEPAHAVGGEDGDFARFEVSLTVPRGHVVVATGELVDGDDGCARPTAATAATHKTVRFIAERARDFAWVADPEYGCLSDDVAGTALRVAYRRGSGASWATSVAERVGAGLEAIRRLGSFPHPRLTVAESLGDEVESRSMLILLPSEARERSVARGVAQQYFGGAIATDPIQASWLGEGLASWSARSDLRQRYGPVAEPTGADDERHGYRRRLRRTPAHDAAESRVLEMARVGKGEPVTTVAHEFRDRVNYPIAVDDKASLFVGMLRSVLGAADFDRGLRRYVAAGQQGRVDEATLRGALEDETGRDLEPLFDAWLRTDDYADLSIADVRVSGSDGAYDVAVDVRRSGDLVTPVDLLVRGTDGTERRVRWDAVAPRATLEVRLPSRPDLVWLDPDAIALDANRSNNRRPRQFELVFGWPLQEYRPRGSYVVDWRPTAWYNVVDGTRFGLVLTGAREGVHNRIRLAPSVDIKRGRLDVHASYETPLSALGRTGLRLGAIKSEGRQLFELAIHTDLSPRVERRPQTRFEAGLSSFSVTEPSYLPAGRYDEGTVNQLWLRYAGEYAGPGWSGATWLEYQVSGPQIDSDFRFNRLSMAVSARAERRRMALDVRGFVGLSSDGDRLPRQERFYLAGAGPMAEFAHPGLRSRDSLLTLFNYHLPGDGNIRAYNDIDPALSARRLLTINLEASRQLLAPDSSSAFRRLFGVPRVAVFGDIGKAEGTGIPELANALFGLGVGVRLERRILDRPVTVRFDVPFYVNRPGPLPGFTGAGPLEREARARWRWMLSFQPAL